MTPAPINPKSPTFCITKLGLLLETQTYTVPSSQMHRRYKLVVSGGVDCRRRRRNVYDKKPQRYAKDNRTAYLTARRDKSVAYVTNNKRLYSTFCTAEASYCQIRSIVRPLCDSRATCVDYSLGHSFSLNILRKVWRIVSASVVGTNMCICVSFVCFSVT